MGIEKTFRLLVELIRCTQKECTTKDVQQHINKKLNINQSLTFYYNVIQTLKGCKILTDGKIVRGKGNRPIKTVISTVRISIKNI